MLTVWLSSIAHKHYYANCLDTNNSAQTLMDEHVLFRFIFFQLLIGIKVNQLLSVSSVTVPSFPQSFVDVDSVALFPSLLSTYISTGRSSCGIERLDSGTRVTNIHLSLILVFAVTAFCIR